MAKVVDDLIVENTFEAPTSTQTASDISTAISNHVALPDPHTQYLTAAEGNAAYAPLSHVSDTANPHSVTKAQVGLGNVDNTSDADKPVSTAQATALGLKADKIITISPGTGLTGGGDLSANRTLTLADTAVTPGTYGSSTLVPVITVDAQGRITSASATASPVAPVTSVFGRTGVVVSAVGDYNFTQVSGTITDAQHAARAGGTLHAAVTPSVNGFMSAVDKTKLDRFDHGFLQYRNSALITTSVTTYVTIALATDSESFPNSRFTKTSATDFRADYAGIVKINYKVFGFTDTNDRAFGAAVFKNGVLIPWSETMAGGKNTTDGGGNPIRTNSCAASFMSNCAVNDIFTLRLRSPDGALAQIITGQAYMNIQVYRVT